MQLPPALRARFEVRGVLGRGGMGVVLAARDRELGREVALKLLHSGRDERTVERFRREGELTARLRHPGIVTLHSAGACEGVPFLAYELVPGARTLEDALPQLDRPQRLSLVRDVARALGHAHSEGIVHRDLKPANVLIDPEGRAKVADFGLAGAGDLERLTLTGVMLGTPGFMAPEQFRASKEGLSPRTDVWALGVLLYWCLTDAYPFEGGSLLELERKVILDRPEAPTRIDRSIAAGLEAVCFKALSVSPERRYPDGGAFADDLEIAMSGELPAALPRRPLPVLPLVLGLSLALGSGGLWLLSAGEERRSPLPAADPAEQVRGPTGPSAEERLDAEALLGSLSGSAAPWDRLHAAWRLLREYSWHPDRARAEAVATRLGRRHPLWRLEVGGRVVGDAQGAYALFREGSLIARGGRQTKQWAFPPSAAPMTWPEAVFGLTFSSEGPVRLDSSGALVVHQSGLRVPLGAQTRYVFHLASSPGASIATVVIGTSSLDYRALVVDLRGGEVTAFDPLPGIPAWRSAVSHDGKRAAVIHGTPPLQDSLDTGRGALRLWDTSSRPYVLLAERELKARLESCAFSRDGRLAVGTGSGSLHLFAPNGELTATLHAEDATPGFMRALAHSGHLRALAFDPLGRRLYSAAKGNRGRGHELRCWDLESSREAWGQVTRESLVSSLDVSADGAYLAVGTNAGTIEVYLVDPQALGK